MGEPGDGPSSAVTEHLNGLLHPPATAAAPIHDLSSILRDPAQHFQLDLDQAPKAIAAFQCVAERLRDLMDEATRLANIRPPGVDAVSINAVKEMGQWAISGHPGTLQWALESGAVQMEEIADALKRSLATHRITDEANAARLSRQEL